MTVVDALPLQTHLPRHAQPIGEHSNTPGHRPRHLKYNDETIAATSDDTELELGHYAVMAETPPEDFPKGPPADPWAGDVELVTAYNYANTPPGGYPLDQNRL